MLFETPVKPREQPQKESKLKAFIKRGSEPLLGRQLAQQVNCDSCDEIISSFDFDNAYLRISLSFQRLRLPSHLSNHNQPTNSQVLKKL